MKHNNFFIQPPHKPRKPDGATLGLVICCIFVLVSLGTLLFYLMQSFVGNGEVITGTDAGTLAAARALLGVSITKDQATHKGTSGPYKGQPDTIPQQFLITAFDKNGTAATLIDPASGNPANASGVMTWPNNPPYYTMNSYNEACGIVAVTCLRAAQGGAGAANAAAITNANNLCNICLANFANALATAQLTTAETANAFSTVAANNMPNVLPNKFFGGKPATTMVPNTLDLGCIATSNSANVYLPTSFTSSLTTNTPGSQLWLNSLQSQTQANIPAGANGAAPPYLLAGGINIDTTKWTDSTGKNLGLTAKFCPIPFETNQNTHLIDPPKENVVNTTFKATLPNGANISGTYTMTPTGQYYFSSSNTAGMNALLAMAGGGQSVTLTNTSNSNSWNFSVNGPGSGPYANDASITPNSPAAGQSPGTIYNHFTPPSYTGAGIAPFAPWNVVRLVGQAQEEATNDQVPGSMTVLSAAVANTSQLFPIAVPHGYVRLINGPSFAIAMKNAGLSAATLQNIASGVDANAPNNTDHYYSNVELAPSGNSTIDLAYNGAATMWNIFSFENGTGDGQAWVDIGCDTNTNFYNIYVAALGGQARAATAPTQAKYAAWSKAALSADVVVPQNNYFDGSTSVVDDTFLASNPGGNPLNPGDSNPPSMPFNWDTTDIQGQYGTTQTVPVYTIDAFFAWITYNRNRAANKPAADPLSIIFPIKVKGTVCNNSIELAKADPYYEVQDPKGNTPVANLRATSGTQIQHMTISDALKLWDVIVVSDSAYILTAMHPYWLDSILPVVCANYKVDYLPTTSGGSKTSLTATEYAKAQIVSLYAGWGMNVPANNPEGLPSHSGEVHGDVVPSHPGVVYLPMPPVAGTNTVLIPGATISSGLKDFVGPPTNGFGSWPNPGKPVTNPYSGNTDTSMGISPAIQGTNRNLLVHRVWDASTSSVSSSPPTASNFEQLATPMQLIYDVNVLSHNGNFVNDETFQTIMNDLLTAVQTMNPSGNYQMQDLVTALNSAPVDNPHQPFDLVPAPGAPANFTPAGTIYYLSSNTTTNQLQVSIAPPAGDTLLPADGQATQYWTTYVVAGGGNIDNVSGNQAKPDALKTLVDTADGQGPHGPFPGWHADLGPILPPGAGVSGDASVHDCPYRAISAYDSSINAGNNSAGGGTPNPNGYIYTEDMLQWTRGSGAGINSANFGDLQFYESVGPSMQFGSIN